MQQPTRCVVHSRADGISRVSHAPFFNGYPQGGLFFVFGAINDWQRDMDVFKKGGYPQLIHFNRMFQYKPSIGVSPSRDTPFLRKERFHIIFSGENCSLPMETAGVSGDIPAATTSWQQKLGTYRNCARKVVAIEQLEIESLKLQPPHFSQMDG